MRKHKWVVKTAKILQYHDQNSHKESNTDEKSGAKCTLVHKNKAQLKIRVQLIISSGKSLQFMIKNLDLG